MEQQYLTSGQVAKKLRISISTLKRWLCELKYEIDEKRNCNGWRLFTIDDLELIKEHKRTIKKNGKRFNDTTLLPVTNADEEISGCEWIGNEN